MSETQQQLQNGTSFFSVFFEKAKGFLLSEKTWIFLISQFGAFVILWLAPKVGMDAEQVKDLIFALLAKLGVESVGLTMAKAKVDAEISAAKVQGDAIKHAASVGGGGPANLNDAMARSAAEQKLALALKEISELQGKLNTVKDTKEGATSQPSPS